MVIVDGRMAQMICEMRHHVERGFEDGLDGHEGYEGSRFGG